LLKGKTFNLIESFKLLSDGVDNSLRVTHYDYRKSRLTPTPLTLNP